MNLEVVVAFSLRLTWIVARSAGLESTPSHPGHPGDHDLLLEPSGFSLFVLINLTLESLYLACPFGETDRVRLGYIVCPSTSRSVHEEEREGGSSAGWLTDARFPTRPKQSNLNKRHPSAGVTLDRPAVIPKKHRTSRSGGLGSQLAYHSPQLLQNIIVSEETESGAGDEVKSDLADVPLETMNVQLEDPQEWYAAFG